MKNIKGFDGLYQISNNGIVKALERKVKMPNGGFKIIKEHYPKLSKTKKGYLKVMLTLNPQRKPTYFSRWSCQNI